MSRLVNMCHVSPSLYKNKDPTSAPSTSRGLKVPWVLQPLEVP